MSFTPQHSPHPANDPASFDESLEQSHNALVQARRRLLGATVLLLLACALIPWVLDSTPRAWKDDVILRMPNSAQSYPAKTDAKAAAATSAASSTAATGAVPAKPATPQPSSENKP